MGKTWDRRKDEPAASYGAFLAYRDMGPTRTLDKLADMDDSIRPPSVPRISSLKGLSKDHDWVDRCRDWDNYIRAERDKVAVQEAAKWERRRLAAIEDAWQDGEILRRKAREMADTDVSLSRWSAKDIAGFMIAAAQVQAAALAVTVKPPAELSDAEADAIAGANDPA